MRSLRRGPQQSVAVLLMAFGGVSSAFGPGAVFVTAIVLVGMAHVVSRPIALVREPVLVTVAE